MLVGMPLDGRLFVSFFDVCLACILVHTQDCVVVLALRLFYLDLSFAVLLAQAWGLGRHILEPLIFVEGLFPLFLVHLDVAFLHVGFNVLFVQRDCRVAVSQGLFVLT